MAAQQYSDAAGTPVPPPPAYRDNSVADIFESAAALVGQGSDAAPHPLDGEPGFTTASDPLNLSRRLHSIGVDPGRKSSICVVMVDGLGQELLRTYGSYAPFLKKALSLGTLDAAFPTTTAASLTSLGTASAPGAHGVAGYEVRNPATNTVMNHLSGWDETVDPRWWQPLPTVFERYSTRIRVATISLKKYANSGLTGAGLRGGEFIAAAGYEARITRTLELLNSPTPTLVYLYWGELDQSGHRHGVGSKKWLHQLEELNLAMRRLSQRAPARAGILLTADHGMVNIPATSRIDYSREPELLENVALTAGEPRAVQLYLKDTSDAARAETAARWVRHWGDSAWVLDAHDLYERGYFGPIIRPDARKRIGDVLVCARDNIALYDMRHYRPQALEMVGQHGSLTEDERQIPLLYL